MNPLARDPDGWAEVWLKPDARPVSVPAYRIKDGVRQEALTKLVQEAIDSGKMEPGKGSWNLPVFPVPKKNGEFRLVQDLRAMNEATLKYGHPLPRIEDLVQRQGKNLIWSTFDLMDVFHQMPLRPEHRHTTCMTTPQGVMQWTCLVMGMKNASSQFQRMMEWVLRDLPTADA